MNLKIVSIIFISTFLAASAQAQSISIPQRTIPASMPAPQQQAAPAAEENEIRGYSLTFIAYKFNQQCNLGFSKETIDFLLSQLQSLEQSHGITPEVVQKNAQDADNLYNQDKAKFCEDAVKISSVIKGMMGNIPNLNMQGK